MDNLQELLIIIGDQQVMLRRLQGQVTSLMTENQNLKAQIDEKEKKAK